MIACVSSSCAIYNLDFYPEIHGRVTNNGSPISNALVSLKLDAPIYNSIITTKTDSNGIFVIPRTSEVKFVGPHAFVVSQLLTIQTDTETYKGIEGKRDYIDDIEEEMIVNIVCNVTNTLEEHSITELNGNSYEYHRIKNTTGNEPPKHYTYIGICKPNYNVHNKSVKQTD